MRKGYDCSFDAAAIAEKRLRKAKLRDTWTQFYYCDKTPLDWIIRRYGDGYSHAFILSSIQKAIREAPTLDCPPEKYYQECYRIDYEVAAKKQKVRFYTTTPLRRISFRGMHRLR